MNRIIAAATLFLLQSSQTSPVDQIAVFSETLPSGYRVIIARTPPVAGRQPRIYVGTYVLHGSMQEQHFGLAHLMEHVVANNRSTIAGPARPEGINYFDGNALTRPYYTSFVSVLPPALLASTIHSRMARPGRAENDSQVFATQVARVLAELERDMSGQYPAYKSLVALARGYSPRLSDELSLVRNTDRNELAKTIARIYRPDNALLVIAGDLNIDSTRALVHETADRLRLSELGKPAPRPTIPIAIRTGQSAVIEHQNRSTHYVVGVSWPKPRLGDPDQIPLLIADQLLLGRGGSTEDPTRSDSSAIAIRLARMLGGSSFSDGRAGKWAAPDLVDTDLGVYAILFNTDRSLTVRQVRENVARALKDIRKNAMTDEDIELARESLASFYERWFFEPTYRVLADHLMAYAATGRNPEDVKSIPSRIRQVKPSAVRDAFNRSFLKTRSNIVILPPEQITRKQ